MAHGRGVNKNITSRYRTLKLKLGNTKSFPVVTNIVGSTKGYESKGSDPVMAEKMLIRRKWSGSAFNKRKYHPFKQSRISFLPASLNFLYVVVNILINRAA